MNQTWGRGQSKVVLFSIQPHECKELFFKDEGGRRGPGLGKSNHFFSFFFFTYQTNAKLTASQQCNVILTFFFLYL